jgi:signal transduction histidine kinase
MDLVTADSMPEPAAPPERTREPGVDVLLVDDQPGRLLAYEAMLDGLGVACAKADSGRRALECVLARPFALILLDVRMPDLDGFEVAQLVRQHPRYGRTPIIFVTAADVGERDQLRGYELGAIDYLSMPVAPEVLRSKVAVLAEMHRKRGELETLNRALDAAQQQAGRRQDELLAMLAHELRNPLAPIRNAASVLARALAGDARLQPLAAMIERQTATLAQLLDALLDIARITHDRIRLQPARLALADCVDGALEAVRPLLLQRQLVWAPPATALHVRADRVRLEQCVTNVLRNAVQYTGPGGRIEVTLAAAGAEAVLTVRDDGIGIAPALLSTVFERFGPSRGAGDGLGLGLAICKRLVEMHGGSVACASDGIGRGTTVTLRLPVDTGAPAQQAAAAPAARPRRVLIVDDNVDAAESLAMWMQLQGHDVRTAHGGAAALQQTAAFEAELAFVDLGLPDTDGYALARELRARRPALKLVALTGYGQPEDHRRSAAAGFDAHLVKPAAFEALEVVLRS